MKKTIKKKSPVRDYKLIVKDSKDIGYINRVLIATPTRGTIRMEWAVARYGQTIPVNWSQVGMLQFMNPYVPMRYSVSDAQNLIVKEVIEKDFEWLLLIEDDVVLPPDTIMRFNAYMREEKTPIVSGLYFTKSSPAEPLVFRGRGVSFYDKWKMGDRVWCDGVPTGCLLIHTGILRAMWDESPEYNCQGTKLRRVFDTPRKLWFDPETNTFNATQGTSDLDWCTKVMKGEYFKKAGWNKFQKMKYPFLMDSKIFCRHIDQNGVQYPKEFPGL